MLTIYVHHCSHQRFCVQFMQLPISSLHKAELMLLQDTVYLALNSVAQNFLVSRSYPLGLQQEQKQEHRYSNKINTATSNRWQPRNQYDDNLNIALLAWLIIACPVTTLYLQIWLETVIYNSVCTLSLSSSFHFWTDLRYSACRLKGAFSSCK